MSTHHLSTLPERPPGLDSIVNGDLVELVDATVAAIDIERTWEIERLTAAFQTIGLGDLFTGELRLKGKTSTPCPCNAEGWL